MAAAGIVGSLVLAACSSGSEAGDGAAPAAPRRTSTTAASPVAAAADATTSSSSTLTTTTIPALDLRRADLTSGPYRVICPGGEVDAQPKPGPQTGADGREVVIDSFAPKFFDLTGDGRPEAVVEVACRVAVEWSAGSRSVIVLGAAGGEVVQLGQPLDGSDPTVVGESLAVGRASSSATGAGEPGAPATVVYEPFTYDGTAWTAGSAGTAVQASDPVTVDGIGPLLVGAPFGEVAISSGQPLEVSDQLGTGGACVEVGLPAGPSGVGALGGDGRVHAVHVTDPGVRTAEGLGVGSTEDEIQFSFPGQVSVLPHEFVAGGHYLIVDFPDLPDRVVMFSTDGSVVTDYAAGETGWADLVEGCA